MNTNGHECAVRAAGSGPAAMPGGPKCRMGRDTDEHRYTRMAVRGGTQNNTLRGEAVAPPCGLIAPVGRDSFIWAGTVCRQLPHPRSFTHFPFPCRPPRPRGREGAGGQADPGFPFSRERGRKEEQREELRWEEERQKFADLCPSVFIRVISPTGISAVTAPSTGPAPVSRTAHSGPFVFIRVTNPLLSSRSPHRAPKISHDGVSVLVRNPVLTFGR